jgi:hypothetical protein
VAIAERNHDIKVEHRVKGAGRKGTENACYRQGYQVLIPLNEKGGCYVDRKMETKMGNHPMETTQGIGGMGPAL